MEDLGTTIMNFINDGMLQAVIVAVAILAITSILSHIATRFIRRITQKDGTPLPSSSILVNVARVAVWAVGLSIMLSTCFKVDVNGLIAALGIGGIAISLGAQDTIKNFIGGLQVTLMGIVQPGDHIIVGSVEGITHDVSWRQTVVNDYEGRTHIIPNSVISSTTITKISPDFLVATPVSFINDGRDLEEVIPQMERLAKAAIETVATLEKDPWILMTQIGEYGMWGTMRFVLTDVDHAREARDAALRAIAPFTRIDSGAMLSSEEAAAE